MMMNTNDQSNSNILFNVLQRYLNREWQLIYMPETKPYVRVKLVRNGSKWSIVYDGKNVMSTISSSKTPPEWLVDIAHKYDYPKASKKQTKEEIFKEPYLSRTQHEATKEPEPEVKFFKQGNTWYASLRGDILGESAVEEGENKPSESFIKDMTEYAKDVVERKKLSKVI